MRGEPGKPAGCCPVARRTLLSWFLSSNLTSPGSGPRRSAAACSHTAPTKLSPPALMPAPLFASTSSAYTARRPFRLVMRVSLMPNRSRAALCTGAMARSASRASCWMGAGAVTRMLFIPCAITELSCSTARRFWSLIWLSKPPLAACCASSVRRRCSRKLSACKSSRCCARCSSSSARASSSAAGRARARQPRWGLFWRARRGAAFAGGGAPSRRSRWPMTWLNSCSCEPQEASTRQFRPTP